jgi:glyoxylase-like metal-dependent hydrolase (beta-lactamase superfamily II)
VELLSGVHLVDGVQSNVYLIAEPEGLTVIDAGLPGSGPKIAAYIRQIGREPGELRRILLTHQHVDHVGGAAALAAESGAEVVAHPLDTPAIEGKGPRELPHGPLRLVFGVLSALQLKPVAVTQKVRSGDRLPVLSAGGGLRVIEAPGHTTGEVVYYQPGRKILFAGDAYMHANGTIRTPYKMFNTDSAMALRSVASLAQQVDIEASLCGHGAPILKDAGARLREAVERVRENLTLHAC